MDSSNLLVEGCLTISTALFKRALARIRNREDINDSIEILHRGEKIVVNYWSEYKEKEAFLVVSANGNEPQAILLSEKEMMFGSRSYFVCGCGYRGSKLYLPANSTELKCRECYNLRYELTTINRKSVQGKVFYKTNRLIKLANARAGMNRIFYKGKYTKRFMRNLKLFSRAGFDGPIEDATKLMETIYSQ